MSKHDSVEMFAPPGCVDEDYRPPAAAPSCRRANHGTPSRRRESRGDSKYDKRSRHRSDDDSGNPSSEEDFQPTSKHRQNRDRPSTKVARAPGRSFSSSSYNSQQVTKIELMNNIIQDYSSDEGCEGGDRQGQLTQLFGHSEPVPSGPKRRMSWVDPENDRDSPPPRKYRSEQRGGYRVDRREHDEPLEDREDREDRERRDDRGHQDCRDEHSERSTRRDQRDLHDFREPRNRGDYDTEHSDRDRRTERRSEPRSESCRTEHRRADLTERERRSENRAARRSERDQRATQRREPEPNDSDINHVDSDETESLSPVGNALIADKDPAPVNLSAMGLENSGRQQKRDLFSGKSTGGGNSGGASSGIVKEMPLDTTITSVGGSLEFGESGLLGHESFLTSFTTHSKLMEFVQAPVPNDKLVLCKLTRSTRSSHGAHGVFKLTLDAPGSDTKTMIVARREFKGNGYHTYFYCENEYLGKTKGSNGSTKFTLYDSGLSKKKAKSRRHRSQGLAKQKQLGSVTYVYRKKGPRQLIAQLPEAVPGAVRDGGSKDVFMVNMLPVWDKSAKRYTMKFFGRAAVSSVKNFKLVEDNLREGEERPHKLLFGKVEDDVFSLDFRAPFTPLQAMAYALTSFEKSLKESLKR